MSRTYLLAYGVIWLLSTTGASATDPVKPVLEPDAAVLAKLDATQRTRPSAWLTPRDLWGRSPSAANCSTTPSTAPLPRRPAGDGAA